MSDATAIAASPIMRARGLNAPRWADPEFPVTAEANILRSFSGHLRPDADCLRRQGARHPPEGGRRAIFRRGRIAPGQPGLAARTRDRPAPAGPSRAR